MAAERVREGKVERKREQKKKEKREGGGERMQKLIDLVYQKIFNHKYLWAKSLKIYKTTLAAPSCKESEYEMLANKWVYNDINKK